MKLDLILEIHVTFHRPVRVGSSVRGSISDLVGSDNGYDASMDVLSSPTAQGTAHRSCRAFIWLRIQVILNANTYIHRFLDAVSLFTYGFPVNHVPTRPLTSATPLLPAAHTPNF